METLFMGIAGSLIAGAVLWLVGHRPELEFLLAARRRRRQVRGCWHGYHLSRDTMRAKGIIWIEHLHELRVSPFGRIRGSSRARSGEGMTYSVSGSLQVAALRLYLDNRDAHEGRASFLYPNLLGGDVLVGILVGEDFDQRWFASPAIMSRGSVSEERLTELASQMRINRAPRARRTSNPEP